MATSDLILKPTSAREADSPSLPEFKSPEQERIRIASSESFEMEDLAHFLVAKAGTVITLIGDRDSGKSTLICSIYDRFLHGPYAGLRSSGILTISGLERRAHFERVASGLTKADTERTSLAEGVRFFHFGTVQEADPASRANLLISDRAGETYKDARGNPALVETLVELPIADYLVIVVDGARLADLASRAGAFFAARQTLQMLADSRAADTNSFIQIVFTKIDLIDHANDNVALRTKIDAFKERLRDSFAHRFRTLTFFEIAARAHSGQYPPAQGVDSLIRSWLSGTKKRQGIRAEPAVIQTEFDRLAERPASEEEFG